jgi:hypothetical protein
MSLSAGGGALRQHHQHQQHHHQRRTVATPSSHRRPRSLLLSAPPTAAPPSSASAPASSSADAIAEAKQDLRRALRYTRRGANAPSDVRGQVLEAQAALEALAPPDTLDFATFLPGRWRLIWTTAGDVLPILGLNYAPPPFWPSWLSNGGGTDGEPASPFRVGDVFQRFSAVDGRTVASSSSSEAGAAAGEGGSGSSGGSCVCENIIEFSVAGLADRAVFRVLADCDVRSGRRLALTFREARLGEVTPSPALDAILAPALLPRGQASMRALQEFAGLSLRFPFRSAAQVAGRAAQALPGRVGSEARDVVSRGAPFLATYLDEDVFVGVSTAPSGCFIFERVEDNEG